MRPQGRKKPRNQQNRVVLAGNSKLGLGSLKKLMNLLKNLDKVSSLCCNPDLGKGSAGLLPPQGHTCSPDPDPCQDLGSCCREYQGLERQWNYSSLCVKEQLLLSCPVAFAREERFRAGINSHKKAMGAPTPLAKLIFPG